MQPQENISTHLEQTIKRLSLYIYPTGYVHNESEYSDYDSEEQERLKQLEKMKEQPPTDQKDPQEDDIKKRVPIYVRHPNGSKFRASDFKAPFISNLNNPREPPKSENWTSEEDKRLLEIVFTKNLTPNYAALYLKGRTPAACSRRFSRLKQDYTEDEWAKMTRKPKSLFKKNPKHWDLKQDEKLMEGIRLYGTKWSIISKEIFRGDRTPGAISDRFRVLRRRCGYIENGHGDNEDVELVNESMKSD